MNEHIIAAKEQLTEIENKIVSSKTTLLEMSILETPSESDFEEFNARFAELAS